MRDPVNRAWISTVAAFALHNAEEAWSIAGGWSAEHWPALSWTVRQWPLFALVAGLLTLLVAGAAFALRSRPSASRRVLVLFLWIMLANVAWHVTVSLYTRSVAPGVVTAILLLLPLYVFHLRQLSSMKASTS